jgi:peptidyl-prolyl cis-trans isomerase A (cyclophilin A)
MQACFSEDAMRQGQTMFYTFVALGALLGLCILPMAHGFAAAPEDHPVVVFDTTLGPITLELDRSKAPITVDNFLKYVDSGFYDNLIFHRVIPDFMIQGGGFTADMRQKKTNPPIKNESGNGLSNKRGTIAMGLLPNQPNSADSQFYINLVDNAHLDARSGPGSGYAVFGKVTEGMDTIDKIAKVRTGTKGGHQDVPTEPVIIKSAKRKPAP